MDIKTLKCKYCDETWGRHYGKYCDYKENKTFCPTEYELTDICENCGYTLMEHFENIYCIDGNDHNTFIKRIISLPLLPNDLFEI